MLEKHNYKERMKGAGQRQQTPLNKKGVKPLNNDKETTLKTPIKGRKKNVGDNNMMYFDEEINEINLRKLIRQGTSKNMGHLRNIVNYGYSHYSLEYLKKGEYGRYYPQHRKTKTKSGLVYLSKNERAYLTEGLNYKDLDIVNCSPTILLWLLKKNNIENKTLEVYVNQREHVFKDIMKNDENITRENLKEVFNKIICGGGYTTWAKEYDIKKVNVFIKDFYKEHQSTIGELIMEYPDLISYCKKNKGDDYKPVHTLSLLLYDYESQLLEIMIHYIHHFTKCKIKTLIHDGMLIQGVIDEEELIDSLQSKMKEELGIDMKLKFKKMDCDVKFKEELDKIELKKKSVFPSNINNMVLNNVVNPILGELDMIKGGNTSMGSVDKELNCLLYKSLKSITHADIAEVIYEVYKDNYVCSSSKHKTWYEFFNHRWVECDNGVSLRKHITKDIVDKYKTFTTYCHNRGRKDPDEEDLWDERAGVCTKIIRKLKDVSFKDKLMKECADLMYVPHFEDKLDSNKYLIGFDNGVYDLIKGEFRDGKYEDYITKSVGYDYTEEIDDNIESNIKKFFLEIMPKKENRKYLLRFLSSQLDGKQAHLFHIFTGNGANGKSILSKLIGCTMGGYGGVLKSSYCSQEQKHSSSASPDLAKLKGIRSVIIHEPNSDKIIKASNVKYITGGDTIQARSLHKEPVEFTPQFELVLPCNDMPKMEIDGGTIRRIRVIPFSSKFVENPNPKEKHHKQYKIDRTLEDKVDIWKSTFMRMLIDIYNKVDSKNDILHNPPKDVVAFTKKYTEGSDKFISVLNDIGEKEEGHNISLSYFHRCYKMAHHLRISLKTFRDKIKEHYDLKQYLERLDKRVIINNVDGENSRQINYGYMRGWKIREEDKNKEW